MTGNGTFQAPKAGGPGRTVLIAVGALVSIGLAWLAWHLLTDIDGVAVKEASPTMVDMLPPPPPPPPPPPEQKPPEPQEQAKAEPDPAPQPDKPAPAPMQIDGPAQAGGDAYGLQAGKSGGIGTPSVTGTCTGPGCGVKPVAGTDRFWGRNVANALEAQIEKSGRVNVDAFVSEYQIWVTGAGTVSQARLVRSSGNGQLDRTVLALLNGASGLKPPPPSIEMPQRIRVGRKRL